MDEVRPRIQVSLYEREECSAEKWMSEVVRLTNCDIHSLVSIANDEESYSLYFCHMPYQIPEHWAGSGTNKKLKETL